MKEKRTKVIKTYVTEEKKCIVERLAKENNCSNSDIINDAIDNYVNGSKKLNSLKIYERLTGLYIYIEQEVSPVIRHDLLEQVGEIICLL